VLPGGALALTLAGEQLGLLPQRALWWPARAMLLVADVHLGKAQSFRRLGVPVPGGSGSETLARLSGLIDTLGVEELVCLGDLLHSRHAHDEAPATLLRAWRQRHAGLAVTLVRGNHDDRAGDPPADLGIALVDELWRVGPFALCHHPQRVEGAYVLAGHVHPCVNLGGRARDRLRLPCFQLGAEAGVLPAFGAFTGMHPVRAQAGERLYAIADDAVVALPGG